MKLKSILKDPVNNLNKHIFNMIYSKFSRSFATQASQIKPKVTQLLIDGKFVNSISGKTFDTYNPATEEKITSV